MSLFIRKTRLFAHLLRGAWIVATRFPRASVDVRHALNRAWSLKMLQLCGMKLVVHNDSARLDAGALVVSNHISWIDIYVINAWRPTPFVSKAEIRNWPLIGWFAKHLDTVFIEREKRSDARRIMNELSSRLERGELMCVFPEGTTSSGVALLPFHSNMFQAAVAAGKPVQPLCIYYEDAQGRQTTAPAYIDDLSLKQSLDAMLGAGAITAHVYVGEPIVAEDRRTLAARAQEAVNGALEAMRGPVVAGVTGEVPVVSGELPGAQGAQA
ncbi:lysophospholipid acyltransferase family protein [Paraburkholderia acidisoli]|uniref:1-acyl-sn-glycerol-3-phosphate acyltransferase n=1 Tax=Paraburkholderia acidisoli TaxID=2571748 RepID=A0A7Z2JD50_9BURK|nr:lysophospholipid acyltransferase family protein [Paraburkholderia acidisoli]QGZ60787.1 1-acyl-sn-glycerol-3-phosphate acyltransferase [Paraburkholderia acidisoli]